MKAIAPSFELIIGLLLMTKGIGTASGVIKPEHERSARQRAL
jgi:hypothetical protein